MIPFRTRYGLDLSIALPSAYAITPAKIHTMMIAIIRHHCGRIVITLMKVTLH